MTPEQNITKNRTFLFFSDPFPPRQRMKRLRRFILQISKILQKVFWIQRASSLGVCWVKRACRVIRELVELWGLLESLGGLWGHPWQVHETSHQIPLSWISSFSLRNTASSLRGSGCTIFGISKMKRRMLRHIQQVTNLSYHGYNHVLFIIFEHIFILSHIHIVIF